MTSSTINRTVEEILTAHVMDARFQAMMVAVGEHRSFECVVYGGWLYDFEFFSKAVKGDLESGVTTLINKGSGGLLAMLLSRFLSINPDLRLFAHNYVSLDDPFPSLTSTNPAHIQGFIDGFPSMPLNLLVAEGGSFETCKSARIAIADICDGEAWLLVSSEP